MSRVIINLDELDDLVRKHHTENFLRLRLFAQFHGVNFDSKNLDSTEIYLTFSNVPGIQRNDAIRKLYNFVIDDTKYGDFFVNGYEGPIPHDGDILDLYCFFDLCSKKIEILHMRHVALSELDVLFDFISSEDPLIKEFFK